MYCTCEETSLDENRDGAGSRKCYFCLHEMPLRLEFLESRFFGTRVVWPLGVLSIYCLAFDMNFEVIHGSISILDLLVVIPVTVAIKHGHNY
ncbi:hypothetical protein QR685DRAFT_158367 [Neurospora intermedia]|uniref:Uncharacterized protein n=1 Tax=Neurospora intermedia TaxID=5142 RepID=A0ABR3DK46_NEUIN